MKEGVCLARCLVIGVAMVLLLSGCTKGGGKKVAVKGRVVDGGRPVTVPADLPPGDPGIRVIFLSADREMKKAGEAYNAVVNPQDGTFEVKDIPPGKYRIAVSVGAFGTPDKYGDKFSQDNSQIVRDVKGGEDIVIDLAKPTG
ncbi:MAG TPA: carboxypeptidase-like regulatory domain-containing protein [Gemmataceae bacterium]|nr:carboxypeptidase-like regulatory domain-containing protein [Gemmataceae bacterium]